MDWLILRLLISHGSYFTIFSKSGALQTIGDTACQNWITLIHQAYTQQLIKVFPLSQYTLQLILEISRVEKNPVTQEYDWNYLHQNLPKIVPLTPEELPNAIAVAKDRLLKFVADRHQSEVYHTATVEDKFERVQAYMELVKEIQAIDAIENEQSLISFPQDFEKLTEDLENYDKVFVPTRFGTLDKILRGGIRQGEIHGITANPGTGKTSLLLSIAANMAYFDQKRVLFIETDMPKLLSIVKVHQILYWRHFQAIPVAEKYGDLIQALKQKMKDGCLALRHFNNGELSITMLGNLIKKTGPWDMVILDSMDRMGFPEVKIKDPWDKEVWLINQLTEIIGKYKTPFWLTCQPTKSAAKKKEKESDDSRGSWEKIFRADTWWYINGEEYNRRLEVKKLRNFPWESVQLSIPLAYNPQTGFNWERLANENCVNGGVLTKAEDKTQTANLLPESRGGN